ncbi:MAG: FAD-dependent monooxygenase [Treponema sp.]|nr:FAD-dependent monooxygenase [Treponema sp.]
MKTFVSITLKPEQENNQDLIKKLIFRELNAKHIDFQKEDVKYVQEKKSVDARHGGLKLHIKYNVFIKEDISEKNEDKLPVWKHADGHKTVIIVGSGPAGLFGALTLLEKGIKPVIIERGEAATDRKRSIAAISTKQTVDENSNYCFGEGGAGTFSDGKLYTRSNKRGNIARILKIFVNFGADPKILTDAHPHIGTDALPQIITNMRNKIIELGGEFYFNTKVTDLICSDATTPPEQMVSHPELISGSHHKVTGVRAVDLKSGEEKTFTGDAVVLATGHSASDIYKMIAKCSPSSLEAKTFAVGVRVEHPREIIDAIQYHGKAGTSKAGNLGAAEYRLTTQVQERGVYSFCMCPGGFVVPSQTGPDEIVVNGMSNKNRNSLWSNAAIVVETRSEDIPPVFIDRAKKEGCPALAGLYFRDHLEKLAKEQGDLQKAPAQMMKDFIARKASEGFPKTSYTPGIVSSRLDQWIPSQIADRLRQGFLNFDKSMKGFVCDKALMIAMETRTSTPVRILRDSETLECAGLKGLYPCGEGSGYSGGIVSSAMDGENICKKI